MTQGRPNEHASNRKIPSAIFLSHSLFSPGLKLWASEGIKVGTEWSRISALFSAAEEFCSGVRAKKDKWNTYIGSGIVSAVLRINEGPVGVVQGIYFF